MHPFMNFLIWKRSFWFCTVLLTMLAGGERAFSAATPVVITNQPQDQVVTELLSATFVVGASGSPAPQYQWYRNDISNAGATGKVYTLAPVQLTDNGALFKAVVGAPPLTYITTWRIYRAKLMLAAGHSIAEAAGQTGYGSDLALSRAFKTATGLAPGRWRRECRAAGRNGPGPVKSAALGSSVTKAVKRGQHGRTRPPAKSSGPRASS